MLQKYFTEAELEIIDGLRNSAVERSSATPKLHRVEGRFRKRMFGVRRVGDEELAIIYGHLKRRAPSGGQSLNDAKLVAQTEEELRTLIPFILYESGESPVSKRVEQAKKLIGLLQAIGLDIVPHTMRSDLVKGFEKCCDKPIGYYRPDWQLRGASEFQYKLADGTTTHIHYIKHESEGASLEDEDAVGEAVGSPLASYETNLGQQSLSRP